MGVVVVSGVPGVGKNTVMEAAQKIGYTIVNFGSVMFEKARTEGLVDNRDQMRKLPVERQQHIQRKAARNIGAMEKVVVDTHMSIRTPGGYMPGLPEWVVRALDPGRIVLVEADPEQIARRRAKDPSRRRDNDDIALHQQLNRNFAAACATFTGAALAIVVNADGKVDEAAAAFIKILGG